MPQYAPVLEDIPLDVIRGYHALVRSAVASAVQGTEWDRRNAAWIAQTLGAVDEEGRPQPRVEQLPPPGSWTIWFLIGGRGGGKSRPAAEWVSEKANRYPGAEIALVSPRFGDVRDVQVEGVSGLLRILPPSALRGGSIETAWNRSILELYLSNGSVCRGFSSEKAGRLRGKGNWFAWADEPAEFADAHLGPLKDTTFSNLLLTMREGPHPQVVVSGTPKPNALIKWLLASPLVRWVKFSTYRNLPNLAPEFRQSILSMYEGTRLGLQELYAELVESSPGAIWQPEEVDAMRCPVTWNEEAQEFDYEVPRMVRVVVGLDPSLTRQAGIVVCGLGADGRGYVIEDESVEGMAAVWGRRVVQTFHRSYLGVSPYAVVAETNLPPIKATKEAIRAIQAWDGTAEEPGHPSGTTVNIAEVTAREGKAARAAPVKALSDQDRIRLVRSFAKLEAQMTGWVPPGATEDKPSKWSPDRMDAFVWGMHYLMVKTVPRQARSNSATAAERVPGVLQTSR